MPEDPETDDVTSEAPPPPPPKGKSKLLVVVLMLPVMVVVAYFLVVRFLKPAMPAAEAPAAEAAQEETAPKKEKRPFGVEFLLENLTVNTKEGKRNHYVVVSVSLECEQQGVVDELTVRKSQVSDIVMWAVAALSFDQVSNVAYREDTLKTTIRNKVNEVLLEGRIQEVYFPQFVIQ